MTPAIAYLENVLITLARGTTLRKGHRLYDALAKAGARVSREGSATVYDIPELSCYVLIEKDGVFTTDYEMR